MSQKTIDILQRALDRERAARKQAEKILESKSAELFQITRQLEDSNANLAAMVHKRTTELQGIFHDINDAYVVMDLSGNVLRMNETAIELLQFDENEDRHNLNELVPPSEKENVSQAFQELMEIGSISDFEFKIVLPNETQKLVHMNGRLVKDEKGKPIGAQGIVRDITEDRLNTEIISEQKRELDIILENASAGIVLVHNGQILRTNTVFEHLLGYSAEELEFMHIKDITHPDSIDESMHLVKQMDKGELDKFTIDKRYLNKNGSMVWAKTTVNSVRNIEGGVKYQVALIEDITKEREKALVLEVINDVARAILGKVKIFEIAWEIVNKIAEYLGSSDCVIYILNEDHEVLEQIAAYGDKIRDEKIINKISIPLGHGVVGAVAETGEAEIINDTRHDERYIVDIEMSLSEITVPIILDGKVIGVIDSEHKDQGFFTQAHLETLTNIARLVSMQLNNAISLMQKELAEAKSQELLQALKRSNEELQEYAHVVSHDLKSPLRSINALVSWIREDNQDKLNEDSISNLNLIDSTLENMEHLISDVLEYSSVSYEPLEEILVDLNEIVTNVVNDIQPPAHIHIDIEKKLPRIVGDRTRFKQIFQNLLSNAIKFSDKENGAISIGYKNKKTHHLFTVKDNGIGIEKEYYNKIFEIFQSLNVSTQSSGVGLSIVKKIIDLYNGDIWVESELGEGTIFYFTLKK